jgi:hypothetical protein
MSTEVKARTIRVDLDGTPGPTHYRAACPRCGGQIGGTLPVALPSREVECPICHGKLVDKHTP